MAKVITVRTEKKKSSTKQPGTLELSGYEDITNGLARARATQASAAEQFATARAVLEPIARRKQLEAERAGEFTSKVTFVASDARATFAFTNTFAALDPGCQLSLVQEIGPVFGELFELSETVSVRAGALEHLRSAIIKAGQNPEDYFETTRVVKPVADFRKKRFEARIRLTATQNETLDEVVEQLAAKPALSVK